MPPLLLEPGMSPLLLEPGMSPLLLEPGMPPLLLLEPDMPPLLLVLGMPLLLSVAGLPLESAVAESAESIPAVVSFVGLVDEVEPAPGFVVEAEVIGVLVFELLDPLIVVL